MIIAPAPSAFKVAFSAIIEWAAGKSESVTVTVMVVLADAPERGFADSESEDIVPAWALHGGSCASDTFASSRDSECAPASGGNGACTVAGGRVTSFDFDGWAADDPGSDATGRGGGRVLDAGLLPHCAWVGSCRCADLNALAASSDVAIESDGAVADAM